MVDTERMRRVLDRIHGAPTPPPKPGLPPPPVMMPGPTPDRPEAEGPVEWLRQERLLTEILRRVGQKSPALRQSMNQLMDASRRRQNTLRRWTHGSRVPPPRVRDASVSQLLSRGEDLARSLRGAYARESRRDPENWRRINELARSVGETERRLSALQRRLRR
ncbi:MAG: hypothetical protein IKQ69_03945 [Oscillospiraceae bacterium]|nr:hypothetical protein [Oscillospiraceae bacterium]